MAFPMRVNLVVAAFLLVLGVLATRLWFLHMVDNDFLKDQGDARTIRMEKISAHRGMIRDRTGKPLAISSPVSSLWANPSEVLEEERFILPLAATFDVTPEEFRARLERNADKEFIYLRRHMPPPQAQQVMSIHAKGVYEQREYHRFYPAGETTAHIVGVTNIDDEGQEGVELSYDSWLRGQSGRKKVLKNLYGEIVRDISPVEDAQPGKMLDLSIDLRLQYLAYKELKQAVTTHAAQSGSFVILDVHTGQVLAMVNQPSYNPNNKSGLDLAAVRNRSVTDVFEPGSTVKPLTVAVALESGAYTLDSVIDTNPGFIKVDNKTIPDPSNLGEITLSEIIAHSSQVGITKVALSLNEFDVWRMFQAVGFGQNTGIGFPGESNGYLPNHRRWKDIERATFSYGYGLSVTPLQLAAAYLTIANSGEHRDVSILAGTAGEARQVMSKDTALALREMLRGVVEEDGGTGRRARVDGYSVAGKTGTVRKVGDAGYEDTSHLAFFAGMAPAHDPKVVGVVMINDPGGNLYGGGAVAAPVFSRVMEGALRLLNVAPDRAGVAG